MEEAIKEFCSQCFLDFPVRGSQDLIWGPTRTFYNFICGFSGIIGSLSGGLPKLFKLGKSKYLGKSFLKKWLFESKLA